MVLALTLVGGYLLCATSPRHARGRNAIAVRLQRVARAEDAADLRSACSPRRCERGRRRARARNEYLETIVNESERLTRLVDNVLDFSRIEQGKKIYRIAADQSGRRREVGGADDAIPAEPAGVLAARDVDDDVPPLPADADAIEQAILNLLTNAMKYSGEARGRSNCGWPARTARAVIAGGGSTASAFPREEQARIFEKYYRVPTPANDARSPAQDSGSTLVSHIVGRPRRRGVRPERARTPAARSPFSLPLAGGSRGG